MSPYISDAGIDIAPTFPSELRFCSAIERSPLLQIISERSKNTFKAVGQSCARGAVVLHRLKVRRSSERLDHRLRNLSGLELANPSDARRGSDPGDGFEISTLPEEAMKEIRDGITTRVRFNPVMETGMPGVPEFSRMRPREANAR
jgi:hypothetical protein